MPFDQDAKLCSCYRLKPIEKSADVTRSTAIHIGELSRRTGCNIETIRYYERAGLIPLPPRSASRYRLYDDSDVRRLAFVRRARELGFSLDDVRALLGLAADQGEGTCIGVRQLAARHLTEVRAKIADLRAIARGLEEAIQCCDAGEVPGCPLIDALSHSSNRLFPRGPGQTYAPRV
jgi:MerR family mercuric resistance operon transcriptional regulator